MVSGRMKKVQDRIATAVVRIDGVEQAAAVAVADPALDQQQQAEGDERVAGEVQDVREGRERRLADRLVPVPHDVAGDEQGLPGGHQQPRQPALGLVLRDPDEGDHDRRPADDVVEPALGQAAALEHPVDDERQRPEREVRGPERDVNEGASFRGQVRHHGQASFSDPIRPMGRQYRRRRAMVRRESPERANPPVARRVRRISRGAAAPRGAGEGGQCAQDRAVPSSSAVRKLEPQPQAATAFGLLTVKPAPMSVST